MNPAAKLELPPRIKPMRPSARPLAALSVLGFAAAAVLFFFDPAEFHFYPVCWFHRITGWQCPGCGGLRAMHQLSHGHLLEALRLNALAVAAIPFAAAYAWRRFLAHGKTGAWPPRRTNLVIWSVAAVLLIFGIVRNLPFFQWMPP